MSSKAPFLGVYRNAAGQLVDMYSGQIITRDQIKPNMSPFNGVYRDKDGVLRDLDELIGRAGGIGGEGLLIDTGTLQIVGGRLTVNTTSEVLPNNAQPVTSAGVHASLATKQDKMTPLTNAELAEMFKGGH